MLHKTFKVNFGAETQQKNVPKSYLQTRWCNSKSDQVSHLPLIFHLFPLHSNLLSHLFYRRVRQAIAVLASVARLVSVGDGFDVFDDKRLRLARLTLLRWFLLALVFSYNQLISRETKWFDWCFVGGRMFVIRCFVYVWGVMGVYSGVWVQVNEYIKQKEIEKE